MKEVSAELDGVRAALDRDVVVELEIAIDPAGESGGGADGREGVAQRDLRVAHIARIRGRALQTVLRGERVSRVGIALSARHAQEAEPKFVQHVRPKRYVISLRRHIHGMRRQSCVRSPAAAPHSARWSRKDRIHCAVEHRGARIRGVLATRTDDRAARCIDCCRWSACRWRRRLLAAAREVGQRNFREQRHRRRIQRHIDRVVRKRRAGDRIHDRASVKIPARCAAVGTLKSCASESRMRCPS